MCFGAALGGTISFVQHEMGTSHTHWKHPSKSCSEFQSMPIAADNGEVQRIQTGIAHPIVLGTAPKCVSQRIGRKRKSQSKAVSYNRLGQQDVNRRPKTRRLLGAIDGLNGNEVPREELSLSCRSSCFRQRGTTLDGLVAQRYQRLTTKY
jgi:hypothetical protein